MGFILKMEERKPNKNNPRKRILSLYNRIKKIKTLVCQNKTKTHERFSLRYKNKQRFIYSITLLNILL